MQVELSTQQIGVVGLGIGGSVRPGSRAPPIELQLQCRDDGGGDLVLDREHVLELPIEGLGPERLTGVGADQLSRDPQVIAGAANAAFEDVRHFEFRGNRRNVVGLTLEGERRGAGDHLEARGLAKLLDEFFGEAVGEVLLVLLLAHVRKRQYRNRLVADNVKRQVFRPYLWCALRAMPCLPRK